MQTLSGDDTFGNTLIAFGAPFQDHKARQMMAQISGLHSAAGGLNDPKHQLDRHDTWRKLAEDDLAIVEHNWWHADIRQLTPYEWGVPTQEVLDAAVALRRRLDRAARQPCSSIPNDSCLSPHGQFTPVSRSRQRRPDLPERARVGGDGRVTLTAQSFPTSQLGASIASTGRCPTSAGLSGLSRVTRAQQDRAIAAHREQPAQHAPAARQRCSSTYAAGPRERRAATPKRPMRSGCWTWTKVQPGMSLKKKAHP